MIKEENACLGMGTAAPTVFLTGVKQNFISLWGSLAAIGGTSNPKNLIGGHWRPLAAIGGHWRNPHL